LLRRAAERSEAAFTLLELLVSIAVLVILAGLLLPNLSRAKESARSINCMSNLRQLQLCWQMYADDYAGVFVPNDWIASVSSSSGSGSTNGSGGTNGSGNTNVQDFVQTSWCEGDALVDTTTSNLQLGLLYPYNNSAGIYHCPSDLSTIEDANGNPLPQPRTRSYNMSQSVNGYPYLTNLDDGMVVDALQPCFADISDVTNPAPAQLFVFIDENEFTLEDAQFGYPALIPSPFGYPQWWDMPSNRHNQGANLSFADGHVEHWKWQVPMIPPYPFPGWTQPVPPEQMPDYMRVGNAMRQKGCDWLPD
jgi:prepilin-type processing-associated H-X9-DG protein/prepilin-type N-terminal cleavage/methylation domain-containing protein